ALLDVALHFLTEIDIMQGMTKIEFYIRFLIDDIINEMFGARIRDGMKLFNNFEKNMIARNILRLYITGEMLYLLKDTFSKVFENSIVYANYEVKDELLFYICQEKTRVNEEKVQFLMDIFLPIKFRTRVYWYNHFGIIGSDETMKIDSIALY
ncbi:MAG TPA: iron-dependent peroxidase, partial [Clostridia bacterium]